MRQAAQRVFGNWYERRQNENIAISTAMTVNPPQSPINYPGRYVGFLRECIFPQRHELKEVKSRCRSTTEASKRFDATLAVLASDVPPLPLATAQEIAEVADSLLVSTQTVFDTDVGAHFAMSSSSARSGRLLSSIVRVMKSQKCLELGTAYGLSALFILVALRRNGDRAHLTTLEGFEPQFSLASTMLDEKYPSSVSCHRGMTYEALPAIVSTLGMIDFCFHDAGHSREEYVADFGLVQPILASGSAMLIDDINWSDRRSYAGNPQTYEGWKAIVASKRVERAVEVDGKYGLLLLR